MLGSVRFRSAFLKPIFLLTLGSVSFASLIAAAAPPEPKLDKMQAGYYRLKLGKVDVIALSDGTLGFDAIKELSKPAEAKKLLAKAYLIPPIDASVNAFLVQLDKRLILVDTGTGELFGPSLNKLTASLNVVGVQPEQITDILVTHIHPDHTGGLTVGGRKIFPNAMLHVNKKELDFWTDKTVGEKAPEPTKSFFKGVSITVGPYLASGQVKTFEGEAQLFPGIRTLPAYGHTPGQSYYVLEDGGEKLEFWGDTVHVQDVQFDAPSVTIKFDVDQKQAGTQRKKAFADAARNGYLVAMPHMNFPGIGHVRQEGDHYRWIPVPYVNDALKK
ncbi:glyoxylase-like metal-dependent hydrolase (beta-lactamase superfamily II) [Nitrobacteraceae bacterium AZCC 2146]